MGKRELLYWTTERWVAKEYSKASYDFFYKLYMLPGYLACRSALTHSLVSRATKRNWAEREGT